MSRAEEKIDMFLRWGFRGTIIITSSLVSLFVHNMMTDINTIKEAVQTIKQEQASQKEQIKNIERIVYKNN